MELYTQSKPKTNKKWSPLTIKYMKWLSPKIDLHGYGGKWKGKLGRANTEERILAYLRRDGTVRFLNKFTKTNLELHLKGEVTQYFTGGKGRLVLVMIDIDCHNKEPDGTRFAEYVLTFFPGSYHQPSTNERGNHIFLILDTQGYHPPCMNQLYKNLANWLRKEMKAGNFQLSDVEVKGHIPYQISPTRYYCGTLAKIPLVKSDSDLVRLMATPILTATCLNQIIKTPIKQSITNKQQQLLQKTNQNILVTQNEQIREDKPRKAIDLRSTKERPNLTPDNSTARRMKSAWNFVKEHGYVPEPDHLLNYIRETKAFTEPWTWNEAKRRQDVIRILDKIRPLHNPKKANFNYNDFAKQLMEGHTLTCGKRAIHWEDLSIFLSILETCIIHQPNQDGSVPRDRIEALWPTTAHRKHFRRKWHIDKYPVMREFLAALEVIHMVDEEYHTGKALRYTLGKAHPQFQTTQKIYRPDIDLHDPYALHQFFEAA